VGEIVSGEVEVGTSLWRDAWSRLVRNRLAVLGMMIVILIALACLVGPAIIEKPAVILRFHSARRIADQSVPAVSYGRRPILMATSDGHRHGGRDILARVLSGGQISLMVALIATIVSLLIGVTYGATAGYIGGRLDDLMMRIVDVLYSLPYVIIVIVLLALLPAKTPFGQIIELFIALGAVSWLTMARIVRGQVMSLKNQDFVLAARATGVSTPRIIFRHLIPNALGPVIVYATLTIPTVMLSEAFLSFLGLGVRPPRVSWGSLAAEGAQSLAVYPWLMIFPGVTMALMLFCLNFVGDGLRDALDPQMKKQ
jgi:oligopeptide transport system permease protein